MNCNIKSVNFSGEESDFATLHEPTKNKLVLHIVASILTQSNLFEASKGTQGYDKSRIHDDTYHPLAGIKEFVIVDVENSKNIPYELDEILSEVRAKII